MHFHARESLILVNAFEVTVVNVGAYHIVPARPVIYEVLIQLA